MNPFTPSFGKVPLHMAGRYQILQDLCEALESGPGNPNLSTIVIGARGTGKTTLLTCVSREAQQRGWISVDVSARSGMLDSILMRTKRAASHLVDTSPKREISGINIGNALGIEWQNTHDELDWRMQMEDILDMLAEYNVGLLITVDEVRADLQEMIDLVSTYQHFVREDRKVALLMAGLPFKVSELLSNEDISFLRRAQHKHLGRVEDVEVHEALRKTIEDGGRKIGKDALDLAVTAIDGFPFMMQLVGYRSWSQHESEAEITPEDIVAGIQLAKAELAASIFETTYKELSLKDIEFLNAMLADGEMSAMADISERMNVSASYAAQYKRRLIEQGLIGGRGRGKVGFELPGFREYLESKQ